MSVVAAVLAGTVFLGAGVVFSLSVKRLFLPAWRGSLAVTAVAMTWLCWALALGQLLGAVGLLRRMALLTAAVVTAAAMVAWARVERPARPSGPSSEVEPLDPQAAPANGGAPVALKVGTVVLLFFVAAIWLARTVIALHRGINDPDSLGYHLPFAVSFAQSGYANQHRLLLPQLPVQFYPANDELLSAIALALTHSLAFAAAKNLIFAALTVVAAHALGRAFAAAWLAVAATAVVLGFPVIAFSQPGEATNDTLLLLVLIGGLAVLAHGRERPAPYLLALGAAGLALGVKDSGIVGAAALAAVAAILLLARVARHRWRWAGLGLLTSGALGGSWYVRNAITYHNPIAPAAVSIGPLHLRGVTSPLIGVAFSVAHYAIRGQFLGVFARGLLRALGPLFVVFGSLCVLGTAAGFRARDGFRRGLSGLGAVALAGYLVTPAGAYGNPDQVAGSYVVNLHYAAPALLVAMLGGAIALAHWRRAWLVPIVGVVAVATSIHRGQGIAVWSPELGGAGFVVLVVAALVGAGVVLAQNQPELRRWARPGIGAGVVITTAAVALIAGRYPTRTATDPVVRWASSTRDAAIVASVSDPADLFGPHAKNHVAIMNRLVDGAAFPVDTCDAWMQVVRDGQYRYMAVDAGATGRRWVQSDPAFRMVANETFGETVAERSTLRRYSAVVFQVVGTPNVHCRAAPPS